jgi:hypothetical protein
MKEWNAEADRQANIGITLASTQYPSSFIPVFFSCFHKNHWLHYIAGGAVSEERGDI